MTDAVNKIDLSLINKISHDSIVKHLNQNECTKNIILSKDLAKMLDSIIKFSQLKEHGVDKIFYLDKKFSKDPLHKNVEWVYIVRAEVSEMKIICEQIRLDLQQNNLAKYPYRIIFAPRKTFMCEVMFEEEGLVDYVAFNELENDLVQLDTDTLSMEFPQFFSNYFLHGDLSGMSSIAKGLINIQDWFGTIPNVHLHGTCAKGVYELMSRHVSLNTSGEYQPTKMECKIGHLLLLDRSIDYVTPFCSPLIYEGLLDESFDIVSGLIDIPTSDPTKQKRVKLSNNDQIFEEIRGMHISEVFGFLKSAVSEMQSIADKRNDLNNSNISEMKKFINSDLKEFNKSKELVNLHLSVSEIVINLKTPIEMPIYLGVEHSILRNEQYRRSFEYVEELINRNFDMHQVLRLMILLSRTNDGLSTSDYTQLTNQFMHTYGFDKALLLERLQKVGFLETSSIAGSFNDKDDSKANLLKMLKVSTNYGNIGRKLDIFPGDLNPNQLKSKSKNVDMSYAFNGQYRPIMCKYINQILFGDNRTSSIDEIAKLFPGEYEFKSRTGNSIRSKQQTEADRTVLICFLGGCTHTEIAVLKKMAQSRNFSFLFATTSFLNASKLISLITE